MAPPKGARNNPNGRPPKSRSLTHLLDSALGKTFEIDGEKVSGKKLLADLMTRALLTGRLRFPGDETELPIGTREWIEFAKWTYQYLEPPITRSEVTGADGSPLRITVSYEGEDDNA